MFSRLYRMRAGRRSILPVDRLEMRAKPQVINSKNKTIFMVTLHYFLYTIAQFLGKIKFLSNFFCILTNIFSILYFILYYIGFIIFLYNYAGWPAKP